MGWEVAMLLVREEQGMGQHLSPMVRGFAC